MAWPLIIVSVLIGIASWWWYNVIKPRNVMTKWMKQVPGYPIIGNILDFGVSTESWKALQKHSLQYDGLCLVQLVSDHLVLATNPKFLESILRSTTILKKSKQYRFLHAWLGQGLLTSSGNRWKTSRKLITPAFHFSILEDFVDIFESNADILVNNLEKQIGRDFDVYPYCTNYALDVIYETSMGVPINAQTKPDSDYLAAVKEMNRITVDRGFSPTKMYDFLYKFSKDYYKEKKYLKLLHSRTQAVIATRRKELEENLKNVNQKVTEESGVKRKAAFLDLLLQAQVDGKPLTNTYIQEEVDTLMFEGHDTTAAAISFTIYCISNNPDVQKKLYDEQKHIFEDDLTQNGTHRNLQEMKYLECVIKETLRLYPSVPFYGRETENDVTLEDGKVIPKGVTIFIFDMGLTRDPKLYKNPDKFDPDRFADNFDNKSPYSYLPFSAGSRNCIGQKFAMLEMKSVLSKLIRSFKMLPTNPKHEPILAAETILKSVNGIRIQLEKRRNKLKSFSIENL